MKKKLRKADLILIGGMLAAGLILALVLIFTRSEGATVRVKVDGEIVRSFPLIEDIVYTIQGVNGGTNELVISGGSAEVHEASCPDGLCVNMGKIHYNGESIICLPNKVVVEIIGGEAGAPDSEAIDIIAGGRQG